MSYLGPLTKNFLDILSNEINKKENKEKLMEHIIDPVVSEFFKRYYTYITFFLFIQFIIILLLIYVIYVIRKS